MGFGTSPPGRNTAADVFQWVRNCSATVAMVAVARSTMAWPFSQ
jgi:hypothetical protein